MKLISHRIAAKVNRLILQSSSYSGIATVLLLRSSLATLASSSLGLLAREVVVVVVGPQ